MGLLHAAPPPPGQLGYRPQPRQDLLGAPLRWPAQDGYCLSRPRTSLSAVLQCKGMRHWLRICSLAQYHPGHYSTVAYAVAAGTPVVLHLPAALYAPVREAASTFFYAHSVCPGSGVPGDPEPGGRSAWILFYFEDLIAGACLLLEFERNLLASFALLDGLVLDLH